MAHTADLIAKASCACESAAILLEHGDIDGACNRAYYVSAMRTFLSESR